MHQILSLWTENEKGGLKKMYKTVIVELTRPPISYLRIDDIAATGNIFYIVSDTTNGIILKININFTRVFYYVFNDSADIALIW